jgi:hypothetical protein
MNMADASVFIDHFPETPVTIDEQLGRIFDGVTWAGSQRGAVEELARQYCERPEGIGEKFRWGERAEESAVVRLATAAEQK